MSRFDDIPQNVLDQAREVAAESVAKAFPYLRVVVIKVEDTYVLEWKVGKDNDAVVVTGEEAIAIVEESVLGWVRFADGRPVEEVWRKWLGGQRPPQPRTHTNRDKWPLYKGNPSNPWRFKNKIAFTFLTGPLAGKTVLFQGDNEVTKPLIVDLQTTFTEKRRRPIVKFASRPWDDGKGIDPAFEHLGFSEDQDPIPGLNLVKDTTELGAPRANGNAEHYDDVGDDVGGDMSGDVDRPTGNWWDR